MAFNPFFSDSLCGYVTHGGPEKVSRGANNGDALPPVLENFLRRLFLSPTDRPLEQFRGSDEAK